jgi:protease II
MRHLLIPLLRGRLGRRLFFRLAHFKVPTAPAPPTPPRPPRKSQSFTFQDSTWEDPYSWMSNLGDKVAMRHMDVYMEQEEKYTEAVMSDTERLQSKLQSEMASRLAFDLSTPPLRWGPW